MLVECVNTKCSVRCIHYGVHEQNDDCSSVLLPLEANPGCNECVVVNPVREASILLELDDVSIPKSELIPVLRTVIRGIYKSLKWRI